jgi:hypothetical protein
MPRDKSGKQSPDIPAMWALNAKVPRTSQYGIKSGHCSCWPDCGEFDFFEALPGTTSEPAMDMIKTHYHCSQGGAFGGGGNRDYFERPLAETIKIAAIFSGSEIFVSKLPDSFAFDKTLPDKVLSDCKKTKGIYRLP